MKKLSFLKTACSFVVLFVASILLTSCDSDNGSPSDSNSGTTFNPASFSLTVTNKEITSVGLMVEFDVKNISDQAYKNTAEQGSFSIKLTVKSTDGTVFQESNYLYNLEAGVTSSDHRYIEYNTAKTLDLSTLTAVIVQNK